MHVYGMHYQLEVMGFFVHRRSMVQSGVMFYHMLRLTYGYTDNLNSNMIQHLQKDSRI